MKIKKGTPLITTDKLAELNRFYCEHFGFRQVFASDDFLCLRSDGDACELSFMSPKDEETPPYTGNTVIICLEVDDVDQEYSRLSQQGLNVVQPPTDNPWGDRSTIVMDPAGISVYIYK